MNGAVRVFPPSGTMAGQWAQADRSVGVWKAAAGLDAAINAVSGLEHDLSDSDDGALNPVGINCLRTFPIGGSVIWGARTMRGATALADEYRYVPVRRLLLYIMDWLELNTRWAVFEPNDEQLWSSLRLQIGEFMKKLYKNGALVGASPDKAFFVPLRRYNHHVSRSGQWRGECRSRVRAR
jgi:phage tail sheath protein FI